MFLQALTSYRLDVVAFALLACVMVWVCVLAVHRRFKRIPPLRRMLLTTAATILLCCALAEWAGARCADFVPPSSPIAVRARAIALTRLTVLGLSSALIGTGLAGWTSVALARGELRARAEASTRLQRAKEIADVHNRAKSEFLAVMSHEIRTPLTAVMGFASVLSETKLDSTQRRYLNTVINATERLVTLLNDILDFSKIEEGKLVLERIPFAPALVIHEVIDLLLPKAAEKSLLLHFNNQLGNPLTVQGDPSRLRQIILNLVGNAIKFTDQGSVTIQATWTTATDDPTSGQLMVKVTDTGIGIPSEKLKSLFKMFAQAESSTSRRFGGTGLGLAICHRLVELMGGRIQATSTLGSGSSFSFTVPCSLSYSDTAPSPAPSREEPAPAPPVLGRVLIVDDQELNRELLRVLVRRMGYDADLAGDGREAVNLARNHAYSAIFMDLEMPEQNGFVATSQIRAREQPGHRVPIIAVTAITATGTREKCLAAGMDDYLTKPVYVPALKSTLEAWLARNRSAPDQN